MKKIITVLLLILFGVSGWYFFVKPDDYRITFEVQALPGVVCQTLKTWDMSNAATSLVRRSYPDELEQKVQVNGRHYVYAWHISLLKKNTSRVVVKIVEPQKSLLNRWRVLFTKTQLEEDAQSLLRTFYTRLNEHLENYSVKLIGYDSLTRRYGVYLPLVSTQLGKAEAMMQNYGLISSFLTTHDIQPDGVPAVEITRWDQKSDSLWFNFIFPIQFKEELPKHPMLAYKWIEPVKALKAEYYGNYITSDRAWYELLHEAQTQGGEVAASPIEFFHTNPNQDRDDQKWKAEVFMPLIRK